MHAVLREDVYEPAPASLMRNCTTPVKRACLWHNRPLWLIGNLHCAQVALTDVSPKPPIVRHGSSASRVLGESTKPLGRHLESAPCRLAFLAGDGSHFPPQSLR